MTGSGHPLTLLSFFIPNLFGFTNWMQLAAFFGVIPLMLLFVAFMRFSKQYIWFFLGLIIIPIFYGLGEYNPLFIIVKYIPIINGFRCPSRIIVISFLAISICVGFGWDYMIKRKNDPIFKRCFFIISAIYLLVIPISFVAQYFRLNILSVGYTYIQKNIINKPPHYHTFQYYIEKMDRIYDQFLVDISIFNPMNLSTFLVIILFSLVLYLFQRNKINHYVFTIVVFVLMVFNVTQFKLTIPMISKDNVFKLSMYNRHNQDSFVTQGRVYQWLTEDYFRTFKYSSMDLNHYFQYSMFNLISQTPVIDIDKISLFLKKRNDYLFFRWSNCKRIWS